MSKPRSTRIRKGVEVINAGRRATVIRTTTLNVHGPMADLIYQDDESIGCAMIADLVRVDDAAGAAAQDAAEQAEADEHEQQELDATGKHEETLAEQVEDPKAEAITALFGGRPPEQRCPRCAGLNGYHGSVHVRHGNGGGHNEPCPNTPAAPAPVPEGPRSECCGEPMSPENRCENCGARGTAELQTWDDCDVVARTELLHPITHPYRVNEVVEYHGPSGIGSWVHGPLHFRRMVELDMAEIMTMSGPKYVEVADLRRPSGNIAIELAPEDIPRIFQALALEAERLAGSQPEHAHAHAVELRDRFAALHP
jgi:hypothetical protein